MIGRLTRVPYESRTNRYVARLAVLPDEPCTRGHMTSAAVLHIKSTEPKRRPFASEESTQHAISHATCCSHCAGLGPSSLSVTEAATATLHCKAATHHFMCSLAPPAPTSKLPVHSLALLRLSVLSVRRFTGCSVHRTCGKEWGTSINKGIYSNHVSRDRRTWE